MCPNIVPWQSRRWQKEIPASGQGLASLSPWQVLHKGRKSECVRMRGSEGVRGGAKAFETAFYVDDCLTGTDSVEDVT